MLFLFHSLLITYLVILGFKCFICLLLLKLSLAYVNIYEHVQDVTF